MPFINMTQHIIRIADQGGNVTHEIPSVGVMRLPVNKLVDQTVEGVPVYRVQYGLPTHLPPMQPGVFYIVSKPAAAAIRRPDYICPATDHTALRKDGQVWAVRSFESF